MFSDIEAVFFDIDGTLVDVFSIHVKSYEQAFRKETGLRFQGQFSDWFYLGTDELVWIRAVKEAGLTPSPLLIKGLLRSRQLEFEHLLDRVSPSVVLPGVKRLLKRLQKEKKRLFVLSGNTRRVGELILRKTRLAPFFEASFFSTDSVSIVDKSTLLAFALRKSSVAPDNALVVGDSPADIVAAQKNAVSALAVATGFHSTQNLKDCGFGGVVSSLSSLVKKATDVK